MEIQDVKTLLRYENNQDDEYLAAVLPLIKEMVRSYLGEPFINTETGEDLFPAAVKLAIAKWCQAYTNPAGVASQSLGAASFAFEDGAIPKAVKQLLDQYKRGSSAFGFVAAPTRRPLLGAPYWSTGGESDVE